MYLSSAGAGNTASGNTFCTSCADIPAYDFSVSYPSSPPILLKLYVKPLNDMTLSNAPVIPTLLVFNKIDNYEALEIDEDDLTTERTKLHYTLDEWKHTWMGQLGDNVIFISAIEKSNIEELKKLLYSKVREIHVTRFPYNNFLYPEIN